MLEGRMSDEATSEGAPSAPTAPTAAPAAPTAPAAPATPPPATPPPAMPVADGHAGSNTQISASSAPHDASSKWICEMCTYENFPLSRKCTMCRAAKPSLGEDIYRLQDGASALPARDDHDAESVVRSSCGSGGAVAAVAAGGAVGGAVGGAGGGVGGAGGKWSCSVCTFDNWPRSNKCAMCGAPAGNLARVTSSVTGAAEDSERRAKRRNNTDWMWLQACLGVVEGDARCVDAYLAGGGDPARALTQLEVSLLNRASAFDAGHTLVHLAIRFQRQEILSTLLSRISGGGPGLKRSPSYIAPELAAAIRRHIAASLRHKKGSFPCRYLADFCTFTLPAEIEDLPGPVQEQLFSELLDREAQHTLETDQPLINWNLDLAGSRLYALWNRSAGDCLLDAVCQAAYGVFDRGASLRRALAESMQHAARAFSQRCAGWERAQAARLQYTPDDAQLRAEWSRALSAAARPGTPLTQIHVWVLSHVLRRPIVVYGVNVVNSFRGEAIGFASFQGIYLPLLWESPVCRSPLALGYTRGHFSALVCIDPACHYICREREQPEEVNYLPLTDYEGKLLPVHFLTCDELGSEEALVRRWVSVSSSRGSLVARQAAGPRAAPTDQMLAAWLDHYRNIGSEGGGTFPARLQPSTVTSLPAADYSPADTDDE